MNANDNKYLLLRGKTYWARVSVPRTLQHLLGTHLRESLKTGDIQEANKRKLAVVVILKNRIDEAKLSGKPKEPQFLRDWQVWRKRLQELRAADDFNGRTEQDYLERAHLSTNRMALEAAEHALMDKLNKLAVTIGDEQAEILYRKITEPKALLSELVAEYLALDTLSHDTQRKGRTALTELVSNMSEDLPPHKIDPHEMLAFTDTLNSSQLTPNTRRDRRSSLSQFWKWLERRLHVPKDSNPFTKRDIEIKGGTEEASEAFTPEEVTLILNADFLQPWRRDVFLVLMLTGARPSEICGLQMKHIDTEAKTFRIERSKTNAGERLLPYAHEVLVSVFDKYHSSDPKRANELLFPMVLSKSERQGKPYINFFSRLKKNLKLRNEACLYSARKSFISTCLDLSLDHVNIQRYVGHKLSKEDKLILGTYSAGRSLLGLVEVASKFSYPYKVE